MTRSRSFVFEGRAGGWLGTILLSWLVIILTLGIALPYAYVLMLRWVARHTYVDGRRLSFNGSAIGLFGNWLKWWVLTILTLGIYSLWVVPRMIKWAIERTDFDDLPTTVPIYLEPDKARPSRRKSLLGRDRGVLSLPDDLEEELPAPAPPEQTSGPDFQTEHGICQSCGKRFQRITKSEPWSRCPTCGGERSGIETADR